MGWMLPGSCSAVTLNTMNQPDTTCNFLLVAQDTVSVPRTAPHAHKPQLQVTWLSVVPFFAQTLVCKPRLLLVPQRTPSASGNTHTVDADRWKS